MSAASPGPTSSAAASAVSAGTRKRSVRCKVCGPCHAEDCGTCNNCIDKPKFGGPNKKKKTCLNRKCVNMLPKSHSEMCTTVNAIFGHSICSRPSGMLLGYSRWIVEVSSIRGKVELFTIALTAASRQRSENGSKDTSDPKIDVYLPRRWMFFQTSLRVQVYSAHQDL